MLICIDFWCGKKGSGQAESLILYWYFQYFRVFGSFRSGVKIGAWNGVKMVPKYVQIHVFSTKKAPMEAPGGDRDPLRQLSGVFRKNLILLNFLDHLERGPKRWKFGARAPFCLGPGLRDCPLPPWNPPSRQGSRKRHLQLRLKPASGNLYYI